MEVDLLEKAVAWDVVDTCTTQVASRVEIVQRQGTLCALQLKRSVWRIRRGNDWAYDEDW
jgi:hypothetical protein